MLAFRPACFAATIALVAALLVPVGASAAISVTTPLALQQAINAAESAGVPATISLAPGVYHIGNTISSVVICGPSDITMIGAGASSTILDGDHTYNNVVDVSCIGGSTTLENVTIQNSGSQGYASSGIYANGGLFVLRDSVVQNNASVGIFDGGTPGLTVSGSTIVGNGGGGLWIETAASAVNSTVANNKGPGIAGAGGTLTNVTIAGNQGGIRASGGTLAVVNTIVAGNPGGDCNAYAYTTTSANFTQPAVNSAVSITVSTTVWMAAGQQLWVTTGGYYTVSSITDSTHVVLINLGYANAVPGATVSAGSAVVAGGDPGSGGRGIASGGHNLASDTTCPFTAVSDQNGANPLLGPLADNGGPTPTMALVTGSPAIDAGDDASCPSTDQRGVTRPQGLHCDIGAYELAAPASITPIGSPVTVSPSSAVTVTFATVTQAGNTTVATSTTGPPPPTGYFIAAGATYYTVSTNALFTTAVVCITDPSVWAGPPPPPVSVLLHYNNPPPPIVGVNVTAFGYPIGTTICSIPLTSLSPFVIAAPVTVTVPQTITFGPLGPKTFGDAPFIVSATASSGLTVSFAASGNCTVAVNLVTITGTGSCTITASQAGNANFSTATPVSQTFSIGMAAQTITFGPLGPKTFGDAPFSVSATASSGLTVSFAASGNCTVAVNLVTITGAGSCTITASQAGDANHNAATPVSQTFSIVTANQTITFGPLGPKTFGDAPFIVSATASSGLTVSFAASGNCTVAVNLVTITGAGSCTIIASQAGDTSYNAAPDVAQSFTIGMAAQTITFGPLGPKTFGDAPFIVSATASSGLTVSFAASGNCTVAVNLVTITGAGSCTITASQAGDANHNAATPVSQTFSIVAGGTTVTEHIAGFETGFPTSCSGGSLSTFVGLASGPLTGFWSAAICHTQLVKSATILGGTFVLGSKTATVRGSFTGGSVVLVNEVDSFGFCVQTFAVSGTLTDGTFNAVLTHYGVLTNSGCKVFFATINGTARLTF